MVGLELVRALEDDWRETLDDVARRHGWPTSRDVGRLAARVAELSAAYNDPSRARAGMREAGAARLGFSFARDVPKAAGAVRELVATGALARTDSLRVLDIGAGLGATTWGLTRALQASASSIRRVEALWLDADASSLEVGAALVRARAGRSPMDLEVRTHVRSVDALDDLGLFDVVLFGQILSELDVGLADEARLSAHVALLRRCLEHRLRPGGALVIVEPALRDRTRYLHRIRDALVRDGFALFAPCLHEAACPALVRDSDWCHEDIAVNLPNWLIPVARAAGLRYEGLTFSYLVVGRDIPPLANFVRGRPGSARLRVVSDLIRTKGKREAFLCGQFEGPRGATSGWARVMRLDREASPTNGIFDELQRGELLAITPSPEPERPRISATTTVATLEIDGPRAPRSESR